MNEFDQQRQEANLEILEQIERLVRETPALRFGQILHILRLNETSFNEEPQQTLQKMRKYDV